MKGRWRGRTCRVVVLTPDTPDATLRVSKSGWLGVQHPLAALRAARVSASRPSPPYPAQQSTAAQHITAQHRVKEALAAAGNDSG